MCSGYGNPGSILHPTQKISRGGASHDRPEEEKAEIRADGREAKLAEIHDAKRAAEVRQRKDFGEQADA